MSQMQEKDKQSLHRHVAFVKSKEQTINNIQKSFFCSDQDDMLTGKCCNDFVSYGLKKRVI